MVDDTSKKKKNNLKKPSSAWNINRKEINERLTAIYKADNGSMPDMKKITIKKTSIFMKIIVFVLTIGTIISAFAWVNFFLAPGSKNSSEDYLTADFSGPNTVPFGEEAIYTIRIKNISSEELKNNTLNIHYPQGFIFSTSSIPTKNSGHNEMDIENLPSGSEKIITFRGSLYGGTRLEKMWNASVNFQPTNLNSPLIKTASFINSLEESPFNLSITAPEKISPGQEFEYIFTVTPKRQIDFSQIELVPTFPESFKINSSSPTLATRDRWIIKHNTSSTATKDMVFKLKGLFKNATDDNSVRAQLFFFPSINNNTDRFQIAEVYSNADLPKDTSSPGQNPLLLSVNGASKEFISAPGSQLTFNLTFKNTTKNPLKDIVLKLGLSAPSNNKQSALNWKFIKDKYDGDIKGEQLSTEIRHGQILWDKKKIPTLSELAPDGEVTLEVIIPIKDSKNFNFSDVSEYKISALAQASYVSPDGSQTVSSESLPIILNSDTTLETKQSIQKTEDGKKQFLVSWILSNTAHPLKNITVSASLSSGLEPSQGFQTPAGTAKFNKEKQQLVWTIPNMPESVDILAWEFGLSPATPDSSSRITNITIEGEDVVTGKKINLQKEDMVLDK